MTMRLTTLTLAPLLILFLTGCATTSINDNLGSAQDFARDKLGQESRWLGSDEARAEARRDVDKRLAKPLSVDDAQAIALSYSPAFQAMLAESAVASARASQSARLPNPAFAFEKLVRMEDGVRDLDIGRMLTVSVFELLTLPTRRSINEAAQQRLRLKLAGDMLQTASDARQAWVRAVAAQQALIYHTQVMELAEASAELARRMQAAGNFSRLQRVREQSFYAEAAAQLARAKQAAVDARETLVRALGLDAQQANALKLPERLPDLPATPRAESAVMQAAVDERLDVRLARFELEASAKSRGLTRVESVVNGLHVSGVRNSATGKSTQRGYEIEFPLPIFDFGDAQRAGAQAEYMAVFYRVAQIGVDASSQVRQGYGNYSTAFELARHYRDEIVPLQKTIADEMLLKYNGMLIGVFDLLASAREQSSSVIAAVSAQRDFWLADAALQATLLGRPAGSVMLDAGEAPKAAGAGH